MTSRAAREDAEALLANHHKLSDDLWRMEARRILRALLDSTRQQAEEIERLQGELRMVDSILARRPALDLPTRWQNIEKAITVAARAEAAEAEVRQLHQENERLLRTIESIENAQRISQSER